MIADEIHADVARKILKFDSHEAFTAREIAEAVAADWGAVDAKSHVTRVEGLLQRVRVQLRRHVPTPEELAERMLNASQAELDIFAETLQERYSVSREDDQFYVKREFASDAELLGVAARFEVVGKAYRYHAQALRAYVDKRPPR